MSKRDGLLKTFTDGADLTPRELGIVKGIFESIKPVAETVRDLVRKVEAQGKEIAELRQWRESRIG